jgi:hypothetical protein
VTFGAQSRLVIELAEGAVEVYGLFDIVNLSSTPVQPAAPVVFETPADATGTSVLDGSTPQAKAEGHRITVTGPFAPGNTSVQLAYRLPSTSDTLRIAQAAPLSMPQTTVIVRKFRTLAATLEGVTGQREVPLEGRVYLVLNGKALRAGEHIDLTLTGLPHVAVWPKYTALALAGLIVLGGLISVLKRPRPEHTDEGRRELRARRAAAFEQLVAVERKLRPMSADRRSREDALTLRRASLIAEIESLDDRLSQAAGASGAPGARDSEGAERLGARPAVR